MHTDPIRSAPDAAAGAAIRTIVVPHGIAGVPRRSPVKARKRTPWHPQPDGQHVTTRGGDREWFGDKLFVESKQANLGAACSTSAAVHVGLVIVVILLFVAGASMAPIVKAGPRLVMPATLSFMPVSAQPAPKRIVPPPAAALPLAVAAPVEAVPAPIEAPPTIEPEIAVPETPADAGGVEGGVAGGAATGVIGGLLDEPASAPAAAAPLRVGAGIDPPRKIRDVKPVYPAAAMPTQTRGAVIIEAIIGADGKVHDAKVLRSIPLLDIAALDAVRQWEFEPTRVNGNAVAVVMTVVVTFAIL